MIEQELLMSIIAGIPNFAGFVLMALVMYRILDRQMTLLEEVIKECIDDDQ